MQAVRDGHYLVIDTIAGMLEGPDTDQWTGPTYRHDGIHFNELGLQLHAQGWRDTLLRLIHAPDMEPDNDVDINDIAQFIPMWLQSNCGYCDGADFNRDGNVGLEDFAVIGLNWLQTY